MASKTILVIDADSETEQLIASTLESEGYLVFAVPGGDVGTEMAQKVSPSLIFINSDETGLEMCGTIRGFESLKKVPLVLLKSPIDKIDPAACAAFGIADILNIPFSAAELLEKTAKVLDTKGPIVLHVREKEQTPEIEETAFPDFSEEPAAGQGSGIEPQSPKVSGKAVFDEEPDERDIYGREDSEPADAYVSRDTSRYRRKKSSLPAVIAGVVILFIGIAAGALFYLGMIPGIGSKKTVSVKPSTVAVKPKPAPAPEATSAPAPSPVSTPASAPAQASAPENVQQKQQAAAENKAAPAPSTSQGKAAPTAPSPTPPSSVKKGPSPSTAPEPSYTAKAKPSGKPVYSVQLGVFKSEDNAASFTKKFKGKGYDAFVVKGADKTKGTLYRVLVGKSSDRKESAKLAAMIRDKENIKAVIYAE